MRSSALFATRGGVGRGVGRGVRRGARRGLRRGLRRGARAPLGAGLVLALGPVLVGCAPPAALGPIAVYDARGFHYESNILDGTIRIADGCMTVRWQGADVILMFPDDEVAWDPDVAALTYGGKDYGDGDAISLEAIVHYGRTSGSVPESCPPSVRVYVLESGLD